MSGPNNTSAIFLSYRRSDTGGYAGRLAEELESRFGSGSVFQDISAIAPGSNFPHAIETAIAHSRVLIVLIGDTWLSGTDDAGRIRLQAPGDFVRMEIAAAFRAGRAVLPVLVEQARMPAEAMLPPELKGLARLQALELSDTRWEYDVDRLANAIRALSVDVQGAGRRRVLTWAGGLFLLIAAGIGGYRMLERPADVAGRWDMANGSFWIVVQHGRNLTIAETHYDSKQVWKRGTGVVSNEHLEFSLQFIFEPSAASTGALKLSADGNSMSGEARNTSGSNELLVLTRAR